MLKGKFAAAVAVLLAVTAITMGEGATVAKASGVEQGIDVSQYQGTINWSQVATGGISFAYIRAVPETPDPSTLTDPKFQTNWNGAMGAGITPGAYLFFNASLDPNVEANALINQLRTVNFVRGDLVPAIDVETTEGEPQSTVVANLQVVVNDVQAAIGVPPAIYAAPLWWDSNINSSAFTSDPLWVAHWCSPQGPSCPLRPANNWGGFGYQAWQYADNGTVPGISGSVDLDQGNPIPPTYDGAGSLAGTHFATIDNSGNGNAAIAVTDSRIYAMPSTQTSFGSVQQWSTSQFYGTRGTYFADLDGPGQPASAVAINDSNIFVMKNVSASSFGPVTSWSSVPFYGQLGTSIADVQGNGRSDAVAISPSAIWVMTNSGTGFNAPQRWSNVPFYGTRGTFMADVDGSGRASAVAVNDNSIWVMLSTGSGFAAPQEWISGIPFYGTVGTYIADLDGPGHGASAIAVNGNSIWVEKNNGGSFGAPTEVRFG